MRPMTLAKSMNSVLALVLTTAALLAGQTAWAESSWSVENHKGESNTFTITRSDGTYEQTVRFRTVSLSAYPGQHYTAVDQEYTFPKDIKSHTVTVTEMTASGSYRYQDGTTERTYRFEVTDRGGFLLAFADRTMTNGTSFSADKVSKSITNLVYFSGTNYASGLSSSKYEDVPYTPPTSQVETSGTLSGYVLIDDEYDYAQKAATVSTSTLINTTGATTSYLNDLGYKIYATVCFTEKEKDDGYQYIQVVEGTGIASYDTGYDPEGAVNDPVNSVFKACFELSNNSNAEGKQFFPHRYSYDTKSAETSAGIGITEFSQTNGHLWQQKFKSGYQATTSGSLVFNATVGSITTRFDAGGENNDTWGYKDFFVRMALCDAKAPTKSAVSVSPGRHAKGNTVYVSVAFSEIVTVTGTPTLSTTADNHWGSLRYVTGSGTNVLTFSTTIPQEATGSLNITGISGTVKDLAGNSLSGGVTASGLCSVDADLAYTISNFKQDDSGNYLITCHDDLRGLAGYVNAGNNCKGKTFLQVTNLTFLPTTSWNSTSSTEDNYTSIGVGGYVFRGTYDGQGHTISGIRIYKGGNIVSDGTRGLFGYLDTNGVVRNVHLTDTRISGKNNVGGIAGEIEDATVEDCTVDANVCIHAVVSNADYHGGIVGRNIYGTIQRCISRATLTVTDATDCNAYGGIAGCNVSPATISDCLALGAVIPNVENRAAIVGSNSATLTRNYYRNCTVAGTEESDIYAITLGTNVTLERTDTGTDLPGTDNKTYDNGADIAGVPYGYNGATITLGYSGEVSTGYHTEYSATAGTVSGDQLTMPAEAVTVSVTVQANTYTVRLHHNDGTGEYDDVPMTYDVAQNLPAVSRTDYALRGWSTTENGAVEYAATQSVENLSATSGDIVELHAQWTDINNLPLTLQAIADGEITVSNPMSGMQYSINVGAKTAVTASITVSAGDIVEFYGSGTSITSYNGTKIQCTADCYIYGNIMSLVDETGFATNTTLTEPYTFYSLFKGNTHIRNHSDNALVLPATTLTESCYGNMFNGCTGLTAAPVLPATTLADYCYYFMFYGCTGLTAAPVLPATTLAGCCYYSMFNGCTGLTAAPVLPATTLADDCYRNMFRDCTSLTAAPVLSATTLAGFCYCSMFQGCTSLTAAPVLPATTLANYCYDSMFQDCTSLTAAPVLPATTLAGNCYGSMFQGCTSLTTAPALPATTLAIFCYGSMFQGCTSLTTAPTLPATMLVDYCYHSMFEGCTSLTTAPTLPATTLANNCYYSMFQGCTSLTTAPTLPATTLKSYCYYSMFEGCTSLTTAPTLPATTLKSYCYYSMFKGCKNLNYVICLALNNFSNSTTNWLSGVASSGTFVRDADAYWNNAPVNWTVTLALQDNIDYTDRLPSDTRNIMLYGRTLYRDGDWNTLCLPFSVTVGSDVMEGATAMTLDGETSGFDASTGELTLNFTEVTSGNTIAAGTPFIVKWTGTDVTNPVFSGVNVSGTVPDNVCSWDGAVLFVGTYAPAELTGGDKSVLFLGSNNHLYWPSTDRTIGAFRAFFVVDLNGGAEVKAFVLNFGEEDADGINSLTPDPSPGRGEEWYDLNGRKLSGKPSQKGIYINNGRKQVFK